MDVKWFLLIFQSIIYGYGQEAEILSTNSVLYASKGNAIIITCKINTTSLIDIIYFRKNGTLVKENLLVYKGSICYPATIYNCDHTNKLYSFRLEWGDYTNEEKWNCQADKRTQSRNVTIIIVENFTSIKLTEPPENTTTIDVNVTGVFRCETSLSRPHADILWYKITVDKREIPILNSSLSVAMKNDSRSWTKSTLNYTAKKSDNNALILCKGLLFQVPTDIPKESRKILLNIQYPPTEDPKTNNNGFLMVEEGMNINIMCNISGGNPVANLTWKCNGQNVIGINTYNGTTVTSQISLKAISTYNGKACNCIASHPLSSAKLVETKLNILFSPLKNVSITSNYVRYINASSNVTLSCEVKSGNPVANATWTCDNITVSSVTNVFPHQVLSTTTFQVEKEDNKRRCTCTATHYLWNQQIQEHTILNVYFAPDTDLRITGATNETIFFENDSIVINCSLRNGNPLATLTFSCWMSDTGVAMNNLTTAVSVISSTAEKSYNTKLCKCTADHILFISTLEQIIQTIVYYPPMQPHLVFSLPQPFLEGQEVIVSCNASDGNPYISYYNWTLASTSVDTQSKTLTFSNITKDINNQSLRCRVHNTFTDTKHIIVESNTEIINVHYRPRIFPFNKTLITNEGMTVNTSCLATGNPTPMVQWFYRNNPVSIKYEEKSDLNLTDINRTQQGDYYCKAYALSGRHGNLQSRAGISIVVNYPPDVSILVGGADVSINRSVTLFCNAAGQPDTYTFSGWRHSFRGIEIRNTDDLQTNGNGSYIILHNLSYQDIGSYSCFVDNGIKNRTGFLTQTDSTFIAVKGFPVRIPETLSNPIFTAEQRSLLTAKLFFFTFPNITNLQWYNLSSGNAVSSIVVDTNFSKTTLKYELYGTKVDVSNFAYEALFMIQNFQHSDEGSYSLVVSNMGWSANFTFRAQISGPPESPRFLNISEKTDSEITIFLISGFNGGHEQQFHVMYYEASHDELIYTRSFIDSNEQPQLLKISKLRALTTYVFSVYASNEKGNSTLNETMCCKYFEIQTDAKSEKHLGAQGIPIVGIAAGLVAAVVTVITVIVVVIVLKRRLPLLSKGRCDNGRLNLKSNDKDEEDKEGLHDNILYESAGPEFEKEPSSSVVEYAMVQKKSDKLIIKEDQNLQETGMYSEVKKKPKVKKKADVYANISGAKKGKDNHVETKKQKGSGIEDVYQNMSDKMKINDKDNLLKTNQNKDGLQYAELVFNPIPNGAKFVIHGIDDRTIYAEVDTTQKIDPLPDSDEEDDESRSNPGKQDT